jgi:hypothetical protein
MANSAEEFFKQFEKSQKIDASEIIIDNDGYYEGWDNLINKCDHS